MRNTSTVTAALLRRKRLTFLRWYNRKKKTKVRIARREEEDEREPKWRGVRCADHRGCLVERSLALVAAALLLMTAGTGMFSNKSP